MFSQKPRPFSARAQSSLEYLLILAAFFGVLGVMLPIIFQTTNAFLSAGDDLLAKRIFDEATEQISLMNFLGDGSSKTFEYSPVQSISIYSQGNEVVIKSKNREYKVDCSSPQLILKQDLNKPFSINFEKNGNNVLVFVGPA